MDSLQQCFDRAGTCFRLGTSCKREPTGALSTEKITLAKRIANAQPRVVNLEIPTECEFDFSDLCKFVNPQKLGLKSQKVPKLILVLS